MAKLGTESMKAWYDLLPEDVAASMDPPETDEDEAAEGAMSALAQLPDTASAEDILKIVNELPDNFMVMGRARRIRFLAWLAAGPYPQKMEAIRILTDVDSEDAGEGRSGVGKVAPWFKEDIRAFAESLGARAARGIVDKATLAAVMGAGFEVAGELEMRSGGGR